MFVLNQTTLGHSVTFESVSIHSGQKSKLIVHPAPVNTGVVFVLNNQEIPATASFVSQTSFATTLSKNNTKISTIEHFLSAVAGLGLSNLKCVIDTEELPGMDGSSWAFYYGMKNAGITHQDAPAMAAVITKKVQVQLGDCSASFSPLSDQLFDITISYDHPLIPSEHQKFSFSMLHDHYPTEIARARTYGFTKDAPIYKANNLAQGASVDNAVIFNEAGVENPDGLRYHNEVVRHKTLDAIGDLRLLGGPFIGLYKAYKPGHTLNIMLIRELISQHAVNWMPLAQVYHEVIQQKELDRSSL